jgi:hypothetical protein
MTLLPPLPDDIPLPWERQLGENAPDYKRFMVYLKLIPEVRSLKEVYYHSTGVTMEHLEKISEHYRWAERAAVWEEREKKIQESRKTQHEIALRKQEVGEVPITALRTVREIARLAYSDIRDILSWDADGNVKLVPSDQITDDVAAAIKEFSLAFEVKTGQILPKIKLHDKMPALNKLGEMQKLWDSEEDKSKKQLGEFLALMSEINAGKLDPLVEQVFGRPPEVIEVSASASDSDSTAADAPPDAPRAVPTGK